MRITIDTDTLSGAAIPAISLSSQSLGDLASTQQVNAGAAPSFVPGSNRLSGALDASGQVNAGAAPTASRDSVQEATMISGGPAYGSPSQDGI